MWMFDYYVWCLLNVHFMSPAKIIARNDALEDWLKLMSLNGFKAPVICKP